MQPVPRLLQESQIESLGLAKVHRIFLRLHSQQLLVPLRSFLRLNMGDFSISLSTLEAATVVEALEASREHGESRSAGRTAFKAAVPWEKRLLFRKHRHVLVVRYVCCSAAAETKRSSTDLPLAYSRTPYGIRQVIRSTPASSPLLPL